MAKTLYSQSGKIEYGIKKYTVDTEADKEALNLRTTKMGSKCYVIDTKKWYILNSSNQWIPFVDAGGSGGSGSPFNIKGSVATINNLPTEDNEIGDLYIVQEDHGEWVWLTSNEEPNGYWEKLGTNILPETIVTTTGQMTEAQTDRMRANIVAAQDSLKLTATPTAGPSENTLMSGTWSGATWEQVVEAVLASRLIQVDAATVGKITLLYNLYSETEAWSNPFAYEDDGILYNVFVDLHIDVGGNNRFYLAIINASTKTENIFDTTTTITPADNHIYNCGELTSLTISNPPASGAYSIVFTSGSTATETTFPATILGLEDFAAEANTLYEINVLDNRAVVGSWAVTP